MPALLKAARRALALVLSILLATPAGAQLVVRPGPSAIGVAGAVPVAAFSTQVPLWTAQFGAYLSGATANPDAVRLVSRALEKADLQTPEAREQLRPLALAIVASAKPLLAKPVAEKVTDAELVESGEKLAVLNYPAIRALLPEEVQAQIGAAAWAYQRALWEPTGPTWTRKKKEHTEVVASILAALDAPPAALLDTPAPAAGPGPEVALEVLKGAITAADAQAVVTTIQEKHLCHGGINAIVGAANACFFESLQKAPELADGQAHLARGDGKGPIENVIFVKDQSEKPLSEIVLAALKAADLAGLESVAIPAMRTGSVFGAVERTYKEVVFEIRKGVETFMAGARASLKRVSLVVHNDDRLADNLHNAFSARPERERSLRTDLREARLSGEGFTLTPRAVEVKKADSPIYASLNEPWDLKHLLTPHAPVTIGRVEEKKEFSKPVTSVLNMPIKMPGSDIRVPKELEQFREFLQKIIDHERAVNPEMDKYYMYLTVDHAAVKAGLTHRRPGVHIDGVQGARYKVKLPPEHLYSASDRLGTVFYDQAFDLTRLDPAKQHVHAELERQAEEKNAVRADDYDIAFWDSYSVHRADIATEDLLRTFVRVEVSRKQYDSEGDTHNPLFDYDWRPVARPIPIGLDDRPLSAAGFAAGYHPELEGLDPNEPHTVKNLRRWIEDNLGAEARTDGGKRFYLAEGDSAETRRALEDEGWTIGAPLPKATGFQQILAARTPNGEDAYLILGANGESRMIHMQSFLKLAGVAADRVYTRRGFRSWKPEYAAAFAALGQIPDLVVYGLTRPTIRALIPQGENLAEFWRDFNSKKWELAADNDASRRPMKVVRLADGRVVWFFMPLFGELAGDLMEALVEHGAKNIVVMSATGSIDANAKIGDWSDPRDGTHLTMPTSNTQTLHWAEQAAARGVKTVDMEFGPIFAAFAGHPEIALAIHYIVSDVMAGPNRTDLTEIEIGDIPGLADMARTIIARALGLPVSDGPLAAASAENRPFPTAR